MKKAENMYKRKVARRTKPKTGITEKLGSDTLTVTDDKGKMHTIPSQTYIEMVENKIQMQDDIIKRLQRQVARSEDAINQLTHIVSKIKR